MEQGPRAALICRTTVGCSKDQRRGRRQQPPTSCCCLLQLRLCEAGSFVGMTVNLPWLRPEAAYVTQANIVFRAGLKLVSLQERRRGGRSPEISDRCAGD